MPWFGHLTAPGPPEAHGRGQPSSGWAYRQGLGLQLLELALVDGPGVQQRLGRRDLVGAAALTRVRRRDRPDVRLLPLLHLCLSLEGAFGHAAAARDQVDEASEEGQEDDEQRPHRLAEAANVP